MRTAYLPLALLCAAWAAGAVAQEQQRPLGRLFMTPDWRIHLERQRQLNIQETRNLEGSTMRLDGVVVRSSGPATVWVNGRPQAGNADDTGVNVRLSSRQPGRATLTAGTEPPADLKVGSTINRATRETTSGLADGEVRVTSPAPRK